MYAHFYKAGQELPRGDIRYFASDQDLINAAIKDADRADWFTGEIKDIYDAVDFYNHDTGRCKVYSDEQASEAVKHWRTCPARDIRPAELYWLGKAIGESDDWECENRKIPILSE